MRLSIVLLLIAVLYTPLCNLFGVSIRPDILLIFLFIFALHLHKMMNMVILFITGIVYDVLNFHTLGITSLILITCNMLVMLNTKALAEQKFNITWMVFCTYTLLANLITAFSDAYFLSDQISYKVMLLNIGGTCAAFPLVYRYYLLRFT